MEELNKLLKETEEHMENTCAALKSKLSTLNAGRANPELLNTIKVEAYGNTYMLNNLANVSVQEPRTLMVNVWDKALVNSVDSAIRAANLGFNPVVDGNILKIHIPQPTEERRKELIKLASNYAEDARTTHKKTHRRDALDKLEALKKTISLSDDDYYAIKQKIDKITNNWVIEVDKLLKNKIKELETI